MVRPTGLRAALLALGTRITSEEPSPILKQAPTAVLVAAGMVACLVMPAMITSVAMFAAGIVVTAVATVIAAILTAAPARWHLTLIVPATDFVAVGLLRYGTGGGHSLFAALIVLQVVWFALEDGRRNVVFAVLGTALVLIVPIFLAAPMQDPAAITRAFVTPVALGATAVVINEVSRQARRRLESLRAFAAQREQMLDETRDQARSLAASEASLREFESLMWNVWEATTEQSVIGTDLQGTIDVWNRGAMRILGVKVDRRQARHIEEFHIASELDERVAAMRFPSARTVPNPRFAALIDPAHRGEADAGEWTYVRADGSRVPVHVSVTERTDATGKAVGYLFVGRDRTRELEVGRLKDEFVGLVSHELRTPLSSILGYLELLRDDDEGELSASQLQYVGVAERNAKRLLHLVGDLLFTAQVGSGAFQVAPGEVALAAVIRASVESAAPIARAAGVTLMTDIDDAREEITTPGDAMRLGQAVDNLVSNALKFTRSGGAVTLGLSTDGPEATITVTDTGIGIPADELDKLFGRFFRATTATRQAIPGVGLGLVITRAIVQAHGGAMSVQSEEGVGTTFTVSLPLAQPAPGRSAASLSAASLSAARP